MENMSIERQVYDALDKKVDFSYDEFLLLNDSERGEWIDAWRLAKLLNETKKDILYEGYAATSMFGESGEFDLGMATCIVRSKKRALDVIEKYTDIDLTPAQFILLGETKTREVINDGVKTINQDTAKVLNEASNDKSAKTKESEDLARLKTEEFYRNYGNGFDEKTAIYWK